MLRSLPRGTVLMTEGAQVQLRLPIHHFPEMQLGSSDPSTRLPSSRLPLTQSGLSLPEL